MDHPPPATNDDDPALSLRRDHPLFYAVLVIALAALTGATARQLRRPSTVEAAPLSAEPSFARAINRHGEAPDPQGPGAGIADDVLRVHSQ